MSDDTSDAAELNPYAPPAEEKKKRKKRRSSYRGRADIAEALERLDEHLSDAGAVAADRRAAGARIRPITWICALILVAGIGLSLADHSATGVAFWIGVGLAIFGGAISLIALLMDLSLVERGVPATPEATLKSFYKSIPMGRLGYAWATLSPTAREQTVTAPSLGEVVTGDGEFVLEGVPAMKSYATTFARPGDGQIRTMAIKSVSVRDISDDVAEIGASKRSTTSPPWSTLSPP
jgi:hypothetical protein